MPYYCTVPRCTSMAGKAKNVSFHQFPRDEELAKLWNRILKRGKPYTKYSKVCSLHFKPEDYTITSVGKNKGQWRTLRKDAIPSQKLPPESPVPYTQTRRSPGCWVPSQPPLTDPLVQQQMAQAIYMQTMLAMQAAGASETFASGDPPSQASESSKPSPSSSSLSEIELLLRGNSDSKEVKSSFKCHECSKCFKDPDVYILHKRIHKKDTSPIEKENYSTNIQDREQTLRANPILANLLKTSMRLEPETNMTNILTVENQIMAALASNMEAYIRTLSSMLSNQTNRTDDDNENVEQNSSDLEDESKDDDESEERDEAIVKSKDTDIDQDDGMCVDESDTPMDDDGVKDDNEEIQPSFDLEVSACFSRIETPIDESRVFSNDDKSTNSIKEYEVCDDTPEKENQSDVESVNNDNSRREDSEATNDEIVNINSNCDEQESIIKETNEPHDNVIPCQEYADENKTCEGKNENRDDQETNCVEKNPIHEILDTCQEYADENKTCEGKNENRDDQETNCVEINPINEVLDTKNNFTGENQKDAIGKDANSELCEVIDDKLGQENPEYSGDVEMELIRVEIELET